MGNLNFRQRGDISRKKGRQAYNLLAESKKIAIEDSRGGRFPASSEYGKKV